MKELIQGIAAYRKDMLPGLRDQFRKLAQGQSPDALFVTCSDSRVVPNLLVSNTPGRLFTSRNVGNMVPPCHTNGTGLSTGDVSGVAALEYAILALGVDDFIVCGHASCGVMQALHNKKKVEGAPNLMEWLKIGEGVEERLEKSPFIDPALPVPDRLSQANVFVQLDNILTYPIVQEAVDKKKLRLHAWWFDIANGDVHVFDRRVNKYVILDEAEAKDILTDPDSTTYR